MQEDIKRIVSASITVKQKLLADERLMKSTAQVVDLIVKAFQEGKRVYFAGNGGSAADAQHLAAEFSGRFYTDRHALPAEALHCNTSYLTAVANDYSYDEVYARLIRGIAHPGDILVGLSTSGNSKNMVRVFETAREMGVITIGFTGETGGKMKTLCDYIFNMPSSDTPRIQEAHMLIGHIICELVEREFFKS